MGETLVEQSELLRRITKVGVKLLKIPYAAYLLITPTEAAPFVFLLDSIFVLGVSP